MTLRGLQLPQTGPSGMRVSTCRLRPQRTQSSRLTGSLLRQYAHTGCPPGSRDAGSLTRPQRAHGTARALNAVWRKCGKPNCQCARPGSRGHGPQWNLTRRVAGKTVNVHLKPGPELEKARREVAEHQRFAGLLEDVSAVSEAICAARPPCSPSSRNSAPPPSTPTPAGSATRHQRTAEPGRTPHNPVDAARLTVDTRVSNARPRRSSPNVRASPVLTSVNACPEAFFSDEARDERVVPRRTHVA